MRSLAAGKSSSELYDWLSDVKLASERATFEQVMDVTTSEWIAITRHTLKTKHALRIEDMAWNQFLLMFC